MPGAAGQVLLLGGYDEDGETVIPFTGDLRCVYLTMENHCNIYKDRPYICRLYGTIPELHCL